MVWLVSLFITIFWLLPILWACAHHLRRRSQRTGAMLPGERSRAEERSHALLRDLLDEREYQQLMECGYLDVASPSDKERVYRIPGSAGWVCVYERGRARMHLCVQPVVPLPTNDVIVLHKLMIEGNEEAYLERANEIPLYFPSQRDT
ncbi:MAG TPA: hypothetical protein VJR48_05520 [Ktedonobacterales bacterium]|nr:hypothetical protein [Ktedonobacterales bacterium]